MTVSVHIDLGYDGAEPGVEPVDVEQRQHQQHHVVGGDDRRVDARALLEVGEQRPVREHRALRPAAGAARVDDDGEVLAARGGLDRRRGRGWELLAGHRRRRRGCVVVHFVVRLVALEAVVLPAKVRKWCVTILGTLGRSAVVLGRAGQCENHR